MGVEEALRSIVHRYEIATTATRRQIAVGADTLGEEADALAERTEPGLVPAAALKVLQAARSVSGISASDSERIKQFVVRSLAVGWPRNADELVDEVLKRPDQARYLMRYLPAQLPSHPRLVAEVTERITARSNVGSDLLAFAMLLLFDERQTRSILHHLSSNPEGPLKGKAAELLERSSASASWRRAQQACIARSSVSEPADDVTQCLDCLPLRSRASMPTVDLLSSTPEVRGAWVTRLVRLAAREDMLDAVLEALLWHGAERADGLVMLAGAALCDSLPDQGVEVLSRLVSHPSQAVVLRAEALRRQLDDERVEPDPPMAAGMSDATRRLAALSERHRSSPATWIGDRTLEVAIEGAIREAAARFAGSYDGHWREDEEPLTVKLLGDIRTALGRVERDTAAMDSRRSGGRRVNFRLLDRIISKKEEGAEGIVPGSSFATDVCLIMTARQNGTVLSSRATLVQVKKLRTDRRGRWQTSFGIDRIQLADISDQTASSFYLLLSPETGGRAVPVMSARMVGEYLPRGGRTRRLHRDDVARASRSLAQWLTYDIIGLWSGDAAVEVLKKAAGDHGRRPYLLLELEVTVAAGKPG